MTAKILQNHLVRNILHQKHQSKSTICSHIFPVGPNCEVRKRTKVTWAACRRNSQSHIPRATKFGDVITADQRWRTALVELTMGLNGAAREPKSRRARPRTRRRRKRPSTPRRSGRRDPAKRKSMLEKMQVKKAASSKTLKRRTGNLGEEAEPGGKDVEQEERQNGGREREAYCYKWCHSHSRKRISNIKWRLNLCLQRRIIVKRQWRCPPKSEAEEKSCRWRRQLIAVRKMKESKKLPS